MSPNKTDAFPTLCRELAVPADVCRLRFSSDPTMTGEHIGYTTRNEMVILHYSAEGQIAYIELVGDGKPCQADRVMN